MMNVGMPPEDKLILARKRSLRLVRKTNNENVKLLGNFGLSLDEILPDIKVVYGKVPGFPVLFTLWTNLDEIIEVSGSDPLPLENPAMLVMHEQDVERLHKQGVDIDVSEMSRSPSYPVWYFRLLEFISEDHLVHIVSRITKEISPLRDSA